VHRDLTHTSNSGSSVPASDTLLMVAAALLCIAAAWQIPWIQRRAGAAGLALLALGAILPLADPIRFALESEDQIAYLSQHPWFTGPLPGLGAAGLAAGGAYAAGLPVRSCLRGLGWAAAGIVLPVALAGLTAAGAPWLAPLDAHRYAWPILPQGCIALSAALAVALAAAEAWPRRRGWLLGGVGALVLLEGLTGAAAQGGLGATLPRAAGAIRQIEPDPVWPFRWLELVVDSDRYTAVTRGWGSAGDKPSTVPRWNDQGRLLRLLDDPVLRHFYFDVFRHPVVQVEAADSQIRLTMRELADALVDAPGPRLLYETDAHGRHRQYRVERLD